MRSSAEVDGKNAKIATKAQGLVIDEKNIARLKLKLKKIHCLNRKKK